MARPSTQVNSLLTTAARIMGIGIVVSALLWASGADALLAKATYSPGALFPHLMRQFGTIPGFILILGSLILTLLPLRKAPQLRAHAALIVLTALLAGGLFNQVIVQELTDRPRPRESVLLTTPSPLTTELSGNSMPSGHAAMGFIFAAPFFLLRRQKQPALACAFLTTGLATGAIIGAGRMAAGAHFASDVIIAGTIQLAGAALLTAALTRWGTPRPWHMATLTLIALAALVLGNQFTATLTYTATQPWKSISLPCPITTAPNSTITAPTIQIRLTGYGAPQSTLALTRTTEGTINLRRYLGLFWGLQCTGVLHLPTPQYE